MIIFFGSCKVKSCVTLEELTVHGLSSMRLTFICLLNNVQDCFVSIHKLKFVQTK